MSVTSEEVIDQIALGLRRRGSVEGETRDRETAEERLNSFLSLMGHRTLQDYADSIPQSVLAVNGDEKIRRYAAEGALG